METDHIVPRDDGGTDDIDNAIPVCFECHAEIHSYNDKHPRGRKFVSTELLRHKEAWLRICREQPQMLIDANRQIDVGPIQALIDELEFNAEVVRNAAPVDGDLLGCPFRDEQFRRAVQAGSIAVLQDQVREAVLKAYVAMGLLNTIIAAAWQHPIGDGPWLNTHHEAFDRVPEAEKLIRCAQEELLRFLSAETVPQPNTALHPTGG